MRDILRPILELSVVLPGLLLAYFPVKSYLKQPPKKTAAWLLPLMTGLCIGGGIVCYELRVSTVLALAGITLLAAALYTGTLRISLWKSGTIALSVCAVFACVNSLSRAVSAAITMRMQLPPDEPWFCLGACVFYNAVCWLSVLAAYYPVDPCSACDGRGRQFCADVVCVLGFAAGVHSFESFHDPALSVDAPDRPRITGPVSYTHLRAHETEV